MEIRTEDKLLKTENKNVHLATSREEEEHGQIFTTGDENSESNLNKKQSREIQNKNPALLTGNSNNKLNL